jgi:hypothetical protein
VSELSDAESNALSSALGAENAAVWVYGVSTAFASAGHVQSAINEGMTDHRARRDSAEGLLQDAGRSAPATQAAYSLPNQVTDQQSAITALITAENDCEVGWRSVLETTANAGLRRTALDALTTSATRATQWRITIGTQPAAEPFPGSP